MRKNFVLLSLALAATVSLSGCFIDINDDGDWFGCYRADGPVVDADLEVPDFTGIDLEMSARVEITFGPVQAVSMEGKSDIVDEVDLDVDNGIWRIRTNDCIRNVDDLTFFITTPNLETIRLSSSGDIFSTNVLVVNDLEITNSGSGEIDIAVEGDDLDVDITGSGDINMEGQADELNLNISGSGDFTGFDLSTNRADVRVSGSGDAEVRAIDFLNIRISGSGDVYFKGNPVLDTHITGSGDVIDAN
ncbi:MAG: head GIN domain-containing protein [Saprospiraceae bacterium]